MLLNLTSPKAESMKVSPWLPSLLIRGELTSLPPALVPSALKENCAKYDSAGDKTLHTLVDLRSPVAGLEERIWSYGSETKQHHRPKGLVTPLVLGRRCHIRHAMPGILYYIHHPPRRSRDAHRFLGELGLGITCPGLFQHNYPRFYGAAIFLSSPVETAKSSQISNVYRSTRSLAPPWKRRTPPTPVWLEKGSVIQSSNFLRTLKEVAARTRYGHARRTVESPTHHQPYTKWGNRVKGNTAQSTYVHESADVAHCGGSWSRRSQCFPSGWLRAFGRRFRVDDIPVPETLLVSSSAGAVTRDELGNEVLTSLALSKSC
jgi:hypothetical protein